MPGQDNVLGLWATNPLKALEGRNSGHNRVA